MSPSPSRLGSLRRLSPRERRVVIGGAAVAALMLLTAFGVLPYYQRWSSRSAAIAAAREQRDRLRALVAGESAFRQALEARRTARGTWGGRLVSGSTPALAASELQALVRRYAELSAVEVDRVNVVGEPTPIDGGLTAIPLQLTAQGDIHGLVQLLSLIQEGERLLVVDDLTVTAGAPRSDGVQLLTWSMRLRGPYAQAGAAEVTRPM
jgi:type II secretory pathway component PulM